MICAISCAPSEVDELPYFISPDFTPHWQSGSNLDLKSSHQVAHFTFTNQYGKTITNADFKGKIYVSDFFYTSCTTVCPKLTRNMKLVQDAFQIDSIVKIISHSVTPWIDSIPTLKLYAKNNHAIKNKWHFVTGNKAEIYKLARQSYFAEEELGYNKPSNEFLHTEHFTLIDHNGHIRGVYNGTIKLEVLRLIEDIQVLKKEIIN